MISPQLQIALDLPDRLAMSNSTSGRTIPAKTTSKYELFTKPAKDMQKMVINTDSGSSRPEELIGAIKIVIRIDYTTQNPLQSINFLHLPVQ